MKRVLLFVFLFVLANSHGYGQQVSPEYINGLYRELNATEVDSARLPVLHNIGKYYLNKYALKRQPIYIDSAFAVFKKSVALSEAIHLDDGYGRYESLRLLGTACLIGQDTAAARYYIMQYIRYYSLRHQKQKVMMAWLKYGESCMRTLFNKQALQCFQQALPIAVENKSIKEEIYLRFRIFEIMFNTGNRDSAINKSLFVIKKFGRSKQNLDKFYWATAHFYRYKGDMKKALTYALAAVNDMELYKDTVNTDEYYAEIAQIYEVLGQTEKSITYYKKTIELREGKPIPEEFILRTAGFIIQGYIKLGRFKEALNEANAIEARNPPKTIRGEGIIAQNKAYCYQALKDYSRAEKYYLKMINDFDRAGRNDEMTLLACYDVGSFYAATQQYDKAKIYTRRLGDALVSFDIRKKVEHLRFQVDSGAGDYKQALDHYINYQKLNDSISSEAKSKQIAELQIKYETGQKLKDIELLKKDGQLQRNRVKQANYLRNLTFGGIALLSITLILLYAGYRSNQKKSKEIDLKNASLNQLLTEKDDLLEEKEWLIKEVHHRVKNNLQIVMGLLQRQSSFINNKEALAAIQNSEHRMHSVALIHQKLYQSDTFAMVNMADYIGEMINYLQDSFDLGEHIRFEKDIADIYFEINMAVPLGLILNEAITNAIKYAFPAQQYGIIRVSLNPSAQSDYLLEISDNGNGLPADFDAQKIHSMGFNLMRGLSKQLSGTFNLVNNHGVTIIVNFKTEQHAG